ncbi:hypothetical protein [Botrimarina mediterranea]|uniref:Pyridoxamine 5'-phosphate oxidase n=1 Tax=Botrimarina mediterranea TaxID=2528022 RepID=A0A518KD32_9BACT|nr:hypothetical protein [Botrimarina mediterranea]QDV75713.1 hypothetical protein Spa11_39340 [Botrimarina mediterranea]
MIDDKTLGFADFGGNRPYNTLGNLQDNAKAFLFLMNYEKQRRVKVWGMPDSLKGTTNSTPSSPNEITPRGSSARWFSKSKLGTLNARNDQLGRTMGCNFQPHISQTLSEGPIATG